jgi:hypothetical protein
LNGGKLKNAKAGVLDFACMEGKYPLASHMSLIARLQSFENCGQKCSAVNAFYDQSRSTEFSFPPQNLL